MSRINPSYPLMEVAISTRNKAPNSTLSVRGSLGDMSITVDAGVPSLRSILLDLRTIEMEVGTDIRLGGYDSLSRFGNSANNGRFYALSIAAHQVELSPFDGTPVAETALTKRIVVYHSRLLSAATMSVVQWAAAYSEEIHPHVALSQSPIPIVQPAIWKTLDGVTHPNGLCSYKIMDAWFEGVQEGDIVEVRPPLGHIGTKEDRDVVWLQVNGLESAAMDTLRHERSSKDGAGLETERPLKAIPYDKRRFCIPLARLQARVPSFDVARARNQSDRYQPFCRIDESNNKFLGFERPLNGRGLVFDKRDGRYV